MIKKGDTVIVLSGAHKGTKGTVEKMLPSEGKLIVSGVNIKKKIVRARTTNEKNTIVEKSYPIHISKVSLIDSVSGKATRIGIRMDGTKKVRVARKSGKDI